MFLKTFSHLIFLQLLSDIGSIKFSRFILPKLFESKYMCNGVLLRFF